MLPPPLPGITRNAPAPLSLSSPKKASPYTTLAPEVLATSPFACPSLATKTPIQIYLPKILHPPSNLVPSPISADDARLLGHEPTDAILLGHEDKQTGALTLSKAILLPVGIWENILRKVRAGKWEVLESYMCPREHPALDRKGKGKCQEGAVGCHRAVYDKLEQAVLPLFHEQPAAWAEVMRRAISRNGAFFTSHRMLKRYALEAYAR